MEDADHHFSAGGQNSGVGRMSSPPPSRFTPSSLTSNSMSADTATATTSLNDTTSLNASDDHSDNNYFESLENLQSAAAAPTSSSTTTTMSSPVTTDGPSSRLRKRRPVDDTEVDSTAVIRPSGPSRRKKRRISSLQQHRISILETTVSSTAATAAAVAVASAASASTSTLASSRGSRIRSRKSSSSSRDSSSRTKAASLTSSRVSPSQLKKTPPSSASAGTSPTNLKKPPPGPDSAAAVKSEAPDEGTDCTATEEEHPTKCCICMDDVEQKELASINGCTHRFCFGCIEQWSDRENKCPLCKARFTNIERVHKVTVKDRRGRTKNDPSTKNTKRVKNRNQRYAPSGAALEGLIASLTSRHSVLSRILLSGSGSFTSTTSARYASIRPVNRAAAATAAGPASASGSRAATGQSVSSGGSSSLFHSFLSEEGRAAMAAAMAEDSAMDFSDLENESDNEDNPFSMFLRGLTEASNPSRPTASSIGLRMSFSRTVQMPAMHFGPPARQFANNATDANAGQSENPLEIDDSDDDDDDEIEIVDVRPAASRLSRDS